MKTENIPPTKRPPLGLWGLLILVIFAVGLVAGLLPRLRHDKELKTDRDELSIPTVNVVIPQEGQKLSGMLLPAEARPFVEAPIYARANGYVTKWYVDIGQSVPAGKLLAEIDTPELDQELNESKAGLEQANAALALAKVTEDRWAELLKTSSVSEQEEAEKSADLKLKQANVDAAKATVERFSDLKAFCHVIAPFSGTITARDIDVGDLIGTGKELFRLSDTHTLRIFVRVPQSATPGLAPGADADIIVPEMPGRKFPAKVVRTAGTIDTASRTLLVELDVDNAKNEVIAGSYTQVSFHDMNAAPILTLPSNTLLFRSEGPQVGVVSPDGRVELHNVMLGRDLGANVEVISGIVASDKVIINPSDSLITGTQVRVAASGTNEVAMRSGAGESLPVGAVHTKASLDN
jgi:membrane fusion protein (multidrug efflux system)